MVPPVKVLGEVETTRRQAGSVSSTKADITTRQAARPDRGIALLCAGLPMKAIRTSRATIRVVVRTLAALAMLTVIDFTQATTAPAPRRLEAEVEQAINTDMAPLPQRAALIERIEGARANNPDGDVGARLALLWLRGVKWMLAGIPLADRDGEPHDPWMEQHRDLVVFSEPAGEWLIVPDVIWKLHNQHRDATVAEDIAWLAVQNGLPGECEGYVPCDAHGMNTLDGEYLRRYPAGRHVPEIVERVKGTLEQSVRLMAEPDGRQFLNPATDCGDLKEPLIALRRAVAGSSASADRDRTLVLADGILRICP
jgi:hypothetical protein